MLLELAWRKIFVSLLQFLPFPRPIFHKLSYPLRSMVHTWGLSVLCSLQIRFGNSLNWQKKKGGLDAMSDFFCRPEYSDHQTDTHLICETFQKGESRRGIFMKCAHMLAQKYCKNRRFICDLCRKLHWQLLRSRNIQIHGHFLFYLFFKI